MNTLSPTISRNAAARTFFCGTRSGAGAPDHSPRPNLYPPKVWRHPRSKQGSRQDYVPPLILETQHQLPWRLERKRQRRQESSTFSYGPRRDKVERMTDPQTPIEQPPYQPLSTEHSREYRRYPRTPRERILFPERRPSHTRYTSPSVQENQWRKLPSGHDTLNQQEYWTHPTLFNENPPYDYDFDRDPCRRTKWHSSLDPLYIPTSHDGMPSRTGNKRWSWSSDSSCSFAVSWSPSSRTARSPSLTPPKQYIQPYSHESDIRYPYPEYNSHRSRSHNVEATHEWMTDGDFAPSGDLPVVIDNDEYVQSPFTDHYSGEDGDVGQTTVYTNCEIVARDPRTAHSHQQTHDFDGALVVQLPREGARQLDPLHSSDVDQAEQSKSIESRECKRRKRAYVLPMWCEPPPRNMKNLRREEEGIRYRFRNHDIPEPPENVYSAEPPQRIVDDETRDFAPRRNRSGRYRRQDTRRKVQTTRPRS